MYEKFSDRATKVMELANKEALSFNHEYVGTEHILLGLIKEGSGVAVNVLKNFDLDLRKIRLEVEKLVQSGPEGIIITSKKLPLTPRGQKTIEYSMEEARNLNHNYVGTEHILLGLLREQEGVAAQVLMNLGLKLEEIREEILQLLGIAGVQQNQDSPVVEDTPLANDSSADTSSETPTKTPTSELQFSAENITPDELLDLAESLVEFGERCRYDGDDMTDSITIKKITWRDGTLKATVVQK